MEEAVGSVVAVVFSLIFGAVPFVIVALVIWSAMTRHRRVAEKWAPFAHRTGLHVQVGSFFVHPSVTGMYAGFHVDLRTVTRGSGKNASTYTVMTVNLPIQNGLILSFYKEGFLSKIGKAICGSVLSQER